MDDADPLRGIGSRRGHVEPHQRDSIATHRVGSGSDADRHGHV
jgi:hypothetical protein